MAFDYEDMEVEDYGDSVADDADAARNAAEAAAYAARFAGSVMADDGAILAGKEAVADPVPEAGVTTSSSVGAQTGGRRRGFVEGMGYAFIKNDLIKPVEGDPKSVRVLAYIPEPCDGSVSDYRSSPRYATFPEAWLGKSFRTRSGQVSDTRPLNRAPDGAMISLSITEDEMARIVERDQVISERRGRPGMVTRDTKRPLSYVMSVDDFIKAFLVNKEAFKRKMQISEEKSASARAVANQRRVPREQGVASGGETYLPEF